MYVCVYVCIYVCTRAVQSTWFLKGAFYAFVTCTPAYIYEYVSMFIHMYAYTNVENVSMTVTHACLHIHEHVPMFIHLYAYTNIEKCVYDRYTCMSAYKWTCICDHTRVHLYKYEHLPHTYLHKREHVSKTIDMHTHINIKMYLPPQICIYTYILYVMHTHKNMIMYLWPYTCLPI